MPILNQIRILSESISGLISVRSALVDKAISMGVCWEEIAFVDKFSAIKMCQKQKNCTFREAYNLVNEYLKVRI